MFYYLILGNPLRASPVSSIINLLSISPDFPVILIPVFPHLTKQDQSLGSKQAGRWARAAYKIQGNFSRGPRRPAGVKTRLN